MFALETLESLIKAHGLLFLTPLAIIEGPVVTVLAGYFVRLNYFSLSVIFAVVMAGEILGDIFFTRWGAG